MKTVIKPHTAFLSEELELDLDPDEIVFE